MPNLWVSGEISNLAKPGSGHLYFSLKDADAQIRCAMFRGANRTLTFRPADGDQVLVQGRVSIYEPRGSYQLIVSQMEEAGEGLLRRKFEQLKAQLGAEGLFDESHKQPLPRLPGCIGVVTSPTGAAIRDILHILARRYPAARVIVYPTRVQGDGATEEITRAIHTAEARSECDVLIVARGGGSLEDLWCFNEEAVARAIFACDLPVVSGVGHEIDFSIADLVADVRAPTPSGAAELVVPDSSEIRRNIVTSTRALNLSMQRLLRALQQTGMQLDARLNRTHPGAVLQQLQQRADDLRRQLGNAMSNRLTLQNMQRQNLVHRLRGVAPAELLNRHSGQSATLRIRLLNAMRTQIGNLGNRLSIAAGTLHTVSPLATLERGYAIIRTPATGAVITDARKLEAGELIEARLNQGSFEAVVSKVLKD